MPTSRFADEAPSLSKSKEITGNVVSTIVKRCAATASPCLIMGDEQGHGHRAATHQRVREHVPEKKEGRKAEYRVLRREGLKEQVWVWL